MKSESFLVNKTYPMFNWFYYIKVRYRLVKSYEGYQESSF
jgi:hypothetical protein